MAEAVGLSEAVRQIVEGTTQPVVVVDVNGLMVAANDEFARFFGYAAPELPGHPLGMLLPSVGSSSDPAGGVPRIAGERTARRRDGTEFAVDVTFGTLSSRHAWVTVRVASPLRPVYETTRHLPEVTEDDDAAAVVKIVDGVITDWNHAAERIYGYLRDEAIGRPMSMFIPPERSSEMPAILARIAAGEPAETLETMRLRRDGRRVGLRLTVSPIHDGRGRIVGASTVACETSGFALPDWIRRIEHPRAPSRHAMEINDTIVQRLVVAEGCLELGDTADAMASVRAALAAAREMTDRMLDDEAIVPGGLVRGAPVAAVIEPRPGLADPVPADPVPADPVPADPVTGGAVSGDRVTGDRVTGDRVTGDRVTGDRVTGDPVPAHSLLIADDSPDVRALVRRILARNSGFAVVAEAADGDEAVEAAHAHQPDVVLLDLSMPNVDGLTALPRLVEASPGSRVVVMSGLGGDRAAGAIAHGAVGYLEKTDLFKTLLPLLNKTVGSISQL